MHDDFGAEKFCAIVPMRMLYHTQVARSISIRAFVWLGACAYDAVISTAQIVLLFLALLCFCVFLYLYAFVFVYSPACVSRRML